MSNNKLTNTLLPLEDSSSEVISENKIYNIRNQQVMLDSDVAFYFQIDTKRLNQQMQRNKSRFPEEFCFKLNSFEFKNQRLQNATFKKTTEGRKYLPYVYTEHGIIALLLLQRRKYYESNKTKRHYATRQSSRKNDYREQNLHHPR